MTRAEQRSRRQAALIEGALIVLVEHGLEGFTTGRIAARAGIAQSGFYKYWPDRDAALVAVAEHVREQLMAVVRRGREAVYNNPIMMTQAFAEALVEMRDVGPAVAVFLRFRREPGLLGDGFTALLDQAVSTLATDMVHMGLVVEGDPRAGRLARYAVSASLGAFEAFFDGEITDPQAIGKELGRIAASAVDMGMF